MSIQAGPQQDGNKLLRFIQKAKCFVSEVPQEEDFIVGPDRNSVIFLSLAYHASNRAYLESKGLKKAFLLLLVDTDNQAALGDVNVTAFKREWRLLLAWSNEEAARILETLHVYGAKKAEQVVQGIPTAHDYEAKVKDALTTIKGVNSTDVTNLLFKFKSIKGIANASISELLEVPSIGDKKAKNIFKCFNDNIER